MQNKHLDEVFKKATNGENITDNDRKTLEQSLNSDQRDLFKKAMSDPAVAKKILDSPQARELLRKLSKGSD